MLRRTELNNCSKDLAKRDIEIAVKDADDLVSLVIEKSKKDETIFKVNLDRREISRKPFKAAYDHLERALYLTLGGMQEKPASLTHLNLIDATPFYKEKIAP